MNSFRLTLRAALAAAGIEPCADNSCMFGSPGGMSTNHGCRCLERAGLDVSPEARVYIRRLAHACRALASGVVAAPAAVDRRWVKDGPHGFVVDMGPVRVEVGRWHRAVATGADEWAFEAWADGGRITIGHHRGHGAPLEQCKADAIAAVEAWRDQIR